MPTDDQNMPLFLEDIYDALRSIVQAVGGPKVVASKIWPHKPCDQARRELLDALNRDNPRKLDPEEVLALLRMGREAGFHHAMQWIAAELGYESPKPIEPETELSKLLREYLDCERRRSTLQPKIEEARLKVAR